MLKINKPTGHDDISYNVVIKCFGELCTPVKHGIFPDSLKIAKVTSVHKSSDSSSWSNYWPIFVSPYFSKMLEPIMYTRL